MVSVYWLVAGAIFLALEAFGLPGIGILFAGLGAILVGALIETGLISALDYVLQGGIFFLATTFFALILWRKVKNWRLDPNAPRYHNIVGTEAVVTKPLIGDAEGEVRWSGTLMRAKLLPGTSADAIPLGAPVIIREADGNILKVVPRG